MRYLRLASLAIGIALLVYLIRRLGPRTILELLYATGWNFFPIALTYFVYQLVRAEALARCVIDRPGATLWSMFSIRVAGEAVQYLTFTGPFLAEPAKAWLLKARGLSTEAAFAATITEYLSYTFTSAALSCLALGYLSANFALAGAAAALSRILFLLMFAFLVLAAAAIARRTYLIGAVLKGLSRLPWLRSVMRLDHERVRRMEDILLTVFRERPRLFSGILALEALAQLLLILEMFWLLRAMGLDFPALYAVWIEGAGKFIGLAFFFVPTQIGAAEGVYVVILQSVGLPAAAGLALSLLRRLRSLLVAAAGLAAFWLLNKAEPPRGEGKASPD